MIDLIQRGLRVCFCFDENAKQDEAAEETQQYYCIDQRIRFNLKEFSQKVIRCFDFYRRTRI